LEQKILVDPKDITRTKDNIDNGDNIDSGDNIDNNDFGRTIKKTKKYRNISRIVHTADVMTEKPICGSHLETRKNPIQFRTVFIGNEEMIRHA
jgi:hypothetical protein